MNKVILRTNYFDNTKGVLNVMVYREITRCFIGSLVKRGCKKRAYRIFNGVLEILRLRVKEHPLIVLEKILYIICPKISLLIKKRGGSSYKLPYIISYKRSLSIVIHRLIKTASVRVENTITERIAFEIIDIIKGKVSSVLKETKDIHKTALYNRPFLVYL
jgi:ribosomal protein S7